MDDLAWPDKEEEDRNKDIRESEWKEEEPRPPINYLDFTHLQTFDDSTAVVGPVTINDVTLSSRFTE